MREMEWFKCGGCGVPAHRDLVSYSPIQFFSIDPPPCPNCGEKGYHWIRQGDCPHYSVVVSEEEELL